MAKFVVIDLVSGHVLGSVDSSHRMTDDEILDFIGFECLTDASDPRYSDDYDNCLFDGKRYFYEQLDIRQV